VDSPPPMTMMISIPDRVLLIKVSKLLGREAIVGTCLVFYDLTDITTKADPGEAGDAPGRQAPSGAPRRLIKLPVLLQNRVQLLAIDDVVWLQAEAHYTQVHTRERQYLCNLSLSDLEDRLDPVKFLRTHRSYFINLYHAQTVEREGEGCVVVMDAEGAPRVPVSRSRLHALKAALGLGRAAERGLAISDE
jgi:DNA-binding LytR/AlgR family response regulator